jgi:subtilisin-like proprotein convertase family protein
MSKKSLVLIAFVIIFAALSPFFLANKAALQTTEPNAVESENAIFSFSNNSPIVITDGTTATPYPSEINVASLRGTIQKLTVTLNELQHSFPDDVDVMLVAPNGQSIVLMSDVGGGTNLTNVTITLDDTAFTNLPDTDLIQQGTYKPTNFEPNDNFPPPAPTSPTNSTLSAFNGIDPNGIWRLYVQDDTGRDAGILNRGWSLTIDNGVSGQNTNSINIPDQGIGSIYPSNIKINGLTGSVTGIKVFLNNFSHNAPDDVDILLQSPNGRSVILMSDVGGNNAVSNITLTIDDNALNSLPDNNTLNTGVYKPTNIGAGDVFPQPAPNNFSTANALSVFNGSNPNGTWSLFVVDDAGNNAGSIAGGWAIGLNTSVSACPLSVSPDFTVIEAAGGAASFNVSSPAGCEWNVNVQPIYDFLTITSNQSGEGSATVNFNVNPNFSGARTGFIDVSNNTVSRAFRVQQNSGCPFALGQTSQSFSGRGGLGNVTVRAGDTCFWQVVSNEPEWLIVESAANGNVGNSIVTFRVKPNPTNQPRTGVITVGARTLTVQQAGSSGCPYALADTSAYFTIKGGTDSFGVLAANNCNWSATTNANWITINAGTGAGSGNVTFTVAPNASNVSRTGTITVGNETFSIIQGRNNIPTPFNFDNDNKSDIGVFRPSNGVWYVLRSSDLTPLIVQFGISTDVIVPADYDGDGKTDIAVYRGGAWFILNSSNNIFRAVSWGVGGDTTAPGDYDGDGKADVAVWRPSASTWYVLLSSNNNIASQQFTAAITDVPVPADYDGDGKTDFVLYRAGEREESPSIWFLRYSSNLGVTVTQQYGAGEDLPVVADYDGDGRANMAVFRPSVGTWYRSTDPQRAFDYQIWGANDDGLVPGDYDGDGKADVGVFRSGFWYILNTSNNQMQSYQWGSNADTPIASGYKPFSVE